MSNRGDQGVPCPDCGEAVRRASLKRHRGGGPCRAAQVVRMVREDLGLVPLNKLGYARELAKAGVPYERIPAYGGGGQKGYRKPGAWGHRSRWKTKRSKHAKADPLYEGLGDVLFVDPWVRTLLRVGVTNTYGDRERLLAFAMAMPEEDRAAIVVAESLGGARAVIDMMEARGWTR